VTPRSNTLRRLRTTPFSRVVVGLVVGFLSSTTIAACSGSESTSQDGLATEATSDSAPESSAPLDDGELRIGLLLPLTGPGAELGTAMRDAAEFAIAEVNAAGGVLGQPVRRILHDEGGDADTASRGLAALLAANVDVIVGPASSTVAAATLPVTTSAGVLSCSPTASALALDRFPDGGLFVRTIPSDRLQATALARLVEQSGERRVAVLYLDDPFGRLLADAVRNELASFANLVAFVPFIDTDAEYADEADAVIASASRATIVIGDATAGPRMVESLFDREDLEGDVFVGDALRVPDAASAYARLGPDALERLSGVSPIASARAPAFIEAYVSSVGTEPSLFAGNAADCVTLIALAAQAAQSTVPIRIAQEIPEVSHVGTQCVTFSECSMTLAGARNVDFDGSTGELRIGADGDLVRGLFEVFSFDRFGRSVSTGSTLLAE
jgi:branched-chain amino acid transport system substrate-binding protein